MAEPVLAEAVAHIRFEGRSFDIRLSELDLGPRSSDIDIRQRLAHYLEIPVTRLRDYVIDHHQAGNVTVRPAAVFG